MDQVSQNPGDSTDGLTLGSAGVLADRRPYLGKHSMPLGVYRLDVLNQEAMFLQFLGKGQVVIHPINK